MITSVVSLAADLCAGSRSKPVRRCAIRDGLACDSRPARVLMSGSGCQTGKGNLQLEEVE